MRADRSNVVSKRRGWLPTFFQAKTACCKHQNGCIHNSLAGLGRGFLAGYALKAIIGVLISALLKRGGTKPAVLLSKLGMEAARFGLFLGGFAGIYKAVLCGLRWLNRGQARGWHAALAGLAAGVSIAALEYGLPKTKEELEREENEKKPGFNGTYVTSFTTDIATYIAFRALTSVLTSYYEHFDTFIFTILCGFIIWAFFFEPENLAPAYTKFFNKIMAEDKHIADKWRSNMREASKAITSTSENKN